MHQRVNLYKMCTACRCLQPIDIDPPHVPDSCPGTAPWQVHRRALAVSAAVLFMYKCMQQGSRLRCTNETAVKDPNRPEVRRGAYRVLQVSAPNEGLVMASGSTQFVLSPINNDRTKRFR